MPPPSSPSRWTRLPLMALALIALLLGLWAGLLRLGWRLPPLTPQLILLHGPLMVTGFLGTLISLERAVALSQAGKGRGLAYLAPLLAGLGMLTLFLPVPPAIPRGLSTLGALGLVLIFVVIYRLQPSLEHAIMSLGAALWLVGNALWLLGEPVYSAVPWWAGFLILTIAGERLELARVLVLKQSARRLLVASVGVLTAGLLVSLFAYDPGVRPALGLWLLRYDIARRTVRQRGLTRYIALCLLPGYAWLLLGGLLWLVYGGGSPAGPAYDAMLHTVFVGFVFSMIFGHALIIIPAVAGIQLQYTPLFYLPLGLLHFSLLLRVASDLLLSIIGCISQNPAVARNILWEGFCGMLFAGRQWGGMLNEVAVLLFLALVAFSALRGRQAAR